MAVQRLMVLTLALLASAGAAAQQRPLMEPVLRENFPDAFVMPEGNGSFIAYATNDGENVPMAVSRGIL